MEFHTRKACLDYYSDNFPHLPRYMIEMALDYDLEQSNKKMTGSERRKLKRADLGAGLSKEKEVSASQGTARVLKADEYTPAPMINGTIATDEPAIETAEFQTN